jgi:YbbR domain-containing protein
LIRLLGFVVHNWPLKVAAVVLASLLYGVLVLARDAQQIPVAIRIEPRGQADDAILLSQLGLVTRVRYIAEPDVPVNSDSFVAWVDLGSVAPGDGTRSVDVQLEPVDQRIDALEWEPRRIRVTLDEIAQRTVPIRVDPAEVPTGLDIRPAVLERSTAVVRGAASAVDRVDRVEAPVTIGADAVDIDRDIQLLAVDVRGVEIPEVDVEPPFVRVQITIIAEGETKSVIVVPEIDGEPAPGFEIDGITVEPDLVIVEGDGEQIASLRTVRTQPVVLTGASRTVDTTVPLDFDPGVLPVDVEEVRVVVTLRPKEGTRTIQAGLRLDGALPDRTYQLSVGQVQAVIGGSQADIDRFQPRLFELEVPVTGLPPGRHPVDVQADLPTGIRLVSVSPRTVIVTIGAPRTVPASP